MFKEFGARRMVETWGDDVPDGKVTDFRRAVKAEEDETIVFSWIEYPDRATRDAANEKLMSDPRMKEFTGDMPFDGTRMIFAGFEPIVEAGPGGAMGYADGYLIPVPAANNATPIRRRADGRDSVPGSRRQPRRRNAGASDIPDGKVTDFKRAVHAEAGEAIVFSWVEWPSKEARDAGWEKVMADPRMKHDQRRHAVRRQADDLWRLHAAARRLTDRSTRP